MYKNYIFYAITAITLKLLIYSINDINILSSLLKLDVIMPEKFAVILNLNLIEFGHSLV